MRQVQALIAVIALACVLVASVQGSQLDTFKRIYLNRKFDNGDQLDLERSYNNVVHPFAQYTAGDITSRITNLPEDFSGFFALKETQATVDGEPTKYTPYLLYFSLSSTGAVRLTVYDIPKHIATETFKLHDSTWSLDYKELEISPEFSPSEYIYNSENTNFHMFSKTIGSTGTFILNETLSMNAITIFADFIVNGESVQTYQTPIIYRPVATERTEIRDFKHLMSVLESGAKVSGVYYYYNCLFDGGPGKGPAAIGAQTIATWEYFLPGFISKRGYVAFSESKLIDYTGGYGWIYDYVNVRVYDNNTVNIGVKYATPGAFKTIVNETFECSFG
eukprot:CAMPEP_0168537230 /NCGR_PEP_ID=MMETSP0405-20121227/20167_1 /TAXON_ID=498012 /ORGANISM="Trichosphaerium sp, Strain Am-I-7 wt" /LENGTH=333 /DNA_ID=CAMNT_0008565679 /DNA_START=223 /DNA_END=1221 /DNA_ORIENTATION=-